MSFTDKQIADLSALLNRAHVKQRSQSGRSLSYVEGWHAIAEANRIFGFDAWTRETFDVRLVAERERKIGEKRDFNGKIEKPGKDGWGVSYIAKVRVTVDGVIREGIGSGHGIDVDLGLAHESAIKEAETDAMKRALMTFGNPFGLALYDKEQAQVCDVPMQPSATLTTLLATMNSAKSLLDLTQWKTDNDAPISQLSDEEFAQFAAAYKSFRASFKQEKTA